MIVRLGWFFCYKNAFYGALNALTNLILINMYIFEPCTDMLHFVRVVI